MNKKVELPRREQLSARLIELAPHWNQANRMGWAYSNEMSLSTINRYMRGEVASLPVAEALIAEAEKHLPAKRKYIRK